MSDSTDILASLGISAGVTNSYHLVPQEEYPTGTVASLAITSLLFGGTLGLLIFGFKRLLFSFLRNAITVTITNRTDWWFRLSYEFGFGDNTVTSELFASLPRVSDQVENLNPSPCHTVVEIEPELESLDEVVVG